MSLNHLVVASVIASILCAPATNAFAQALPPAPVLPPQYAPPQYPQRYQAPEQYPPPAPPTAAVAPNGEYVSPLQQTTQPTYVPQSVALSGPRMLKDWEEGQPIPYGYHHETRPRKGMVIAGSVVFGVLYLISAYSGAIGDDLANGGENKAGWMFLPVLGPFLEWSETDSTTLRYMLALDGLAQAAGVTMLVCGLLYPRHLLVRNDLASMTITPMKIGMEGSGFGLVGRF
jgi:hypothetical protein